MKISIRSTDVLGILGAISIALMLWVELTKKEMKQPYFEEKQAAAQRMYESINYLKNKYFKNEISVDNINDPNESKIIGTQFSEITSGKGSLPIKLSTVNPNFSALIVELFKYAELKKGDHIAICGTGSFPALNIAVCTAAEVLGLKVSFIGSVTSSSWGANDPDYTYLDIHAGLIEGGLLKQKIIASSIGGNEDLGRTLSAEGRALAIEAISRNNLEIINAKTLHENIRIRMEIFKKQEQLINKEIKVFVNIGGGIASLGSVENSNTLPSGFLDNIKLSDFRDKYGVIFEMTANQKKIINLLNLNSLLKRHNMPTDPVPLPEVGSGELFYMLKYDYQNVGIALFVLVSILASIIIYDKKQNALGKNVVYENNEASNFLSDSL
ncbi:MAG: poly-gamma-glutamate system protein [Cyclobacteriaceae bacterium]